MTTRFEDFQPAQPAPADQSWLHKARLEAQLLAEGAAGFGDAAKDAVLNHPVQTAGKLALSAAAGIGLAYMSRGTSVLGLGARAIAAGTGLAFGVDAITHGSTAMRALGDTYVNGKISDQDRADMRGTVGGFLFDTALMSAGTLGAGKLWRSHLYAMDRAKVPDELIFQMNKTGLTADYFNKINVPTMTAKMLLEPDISPKRLAIAEKMFRPTVREAQTYSEYWRDQIADYAARTGTQPDAAAIKRNFLDNVPNTRRLDQVVMEMRALGNSGATDKELAGPVLARAHEAHDIIYGPEQPM